MRIRFPLVGYCTLMAFNWDNCPCRLDTTFGARIYGCGRMLVQYGKWPIDSHLSSTEWAAHLAFPPDHEEFYVPCPVFFSACICGREPAMWNALGYILRTQKKMLYDAKKTTVQFMGILQKRLGLYKDVVRFMGQVCFSVLKWRATLESV